MVQLITVTQHVQIVESVAPSLAVQGMEGIVCVGYGEILHG